MTKRIWLDIELGGDFKPEEIDLTEEEVTLEKVVEVVKSSGTLSGLITDWNLTYGATITVGWERECVQLDEFLEEMD